MAAVIPTDNDSKSQAILTFTGDQIELAENQAVNYLGRTGALTLPGKKYILADDVIQTLRPNSKIVDNGNLLGGYAHPNGQQLSVADSIMTMDGVGFAMYAGLGYILGAYTGLKVGRHDGLAKEKHKAKTIADAWMKNLETSLAHTKMMEDMDLTDAKRQLQTVNYYSKLSSMPSLTDMETKIHSAYDQVRGRVPVPVSPGAGATPAQVNAYNQATNDYTDIIDAYDSRENSVKNKAAGNFAEMWGGA